MAANIRRVSSLFLTVPALIFAGLALFLSLLYQAIDLTALSLLVLGAAGGLKLWGSFSRRRVECRLEVDRHRVFAGEQLTLHVSVENRKFLPLRLDLEVPVDGVGGPSAGAAPLTAGGSVLWYQGSRFHWKLTASPRGVHEIGPLRVTSADLLGFFPEEKEEGSPFEVIVYPKLAPLGAFLLPKRDFFGASGAESPVKDPVYILGTTDYHQGRPARYIHWKASARHHRLQEKLFESSAQEKVLLVVDVEGFTGERACEPFEQTLETVAALAVKLDMRGAAIGFLTNGARNGKSASFFRVTRSGGQLPGILEVLARLSAEAEGEMASVVNRGLPLPWGTSCVYFAFDESRGTRMAREGFRRRKVPVSLITTGDLPAGEAHAMAGIGIGRGPGGQVISGEGALAR
jgi:uncharacterized protein (DUF58 family)